MELELFKDLLEDYVHENIDMGDLLAEKLNYLTDGQWDNRTYHYKPDFVALNVKGKGAGDYSKVSDILSEDEYYGELDMNIQYFFNEWEEIFRNNFGLSLDVMGRSGGWWGFKADDLTDFGYVLHLKEDRVNDYYSKLDAESKEYDNIYNVFDESEIEAFFEEDFFDFDQNFIDTINKFIDSVNQTSDEWESDEWNNEIKSYFEESALASSKNKLKESEDDDEDEEDDGWSEDILDEVEGVISDIEQLAYELRSCVRGAYTNCKTRGDLSNYITNLANDLLDAAERI